MRSLFASDERERKLDRIGDPLAALDASVDFAGIAREVEAVLPAVDYAQGGRPRFSVLLMGEAAGDQTAVQPVGRSGGVPGP